MLDLLPHSSLVPFEACRLAQPKLVWNDGTCSTGDMIERYAFVIDDKPVAEPERVADPAQRQTFFAERYGGTGMVNNGGGVRCGALDGVQLKGIGANGMQGRGTNFWYRHGGATLEEGLREALWTQVCNAVLPHGAVPILGVIATGRGVAYPGALGTESVPGALIVREAALRPAHFLRAIYFEPQDAVRVHLPSDAARTRAAVGGLSDCFRAALPLGEASDETIISQGLLLLAQRLAEQQAASRARKIVQGAVTCSNVALDGRLLDFGTTTTVSDYGRIIVARGFPDMLHEHLGYNATLSSLHFSCRKYLPKRQADSLLPESELLAHYQNCFVQHANFEFTQLTGIARSDLQRLPATLVQAMMQSVNELVASGTREPFKLQEMPERMGRFHLNTVFRAAAFSDDEALDHKLADCIPCDRTRARFIQPYRALRAAHLQSARERGATQASPLMALNACRLNSNMPELYRTPLRGQIDAFAREPDAHDGVRAFIEDLVRKAANLLAANPDGHVHLRGRDGEAAILRPNEPLHGAHGAMRARDLAAALPELRLTPHEVTSLEST